MAKHCLEVGLVERGDETMGFSHEKTTHPASREQIRSHLGHLAAMFAVGNFQAPMFIHALNPPGTQTRKRLRDRIRYRRESTPKGARVRITTEDPEALRAIKEFLRFQISEHQTGDSLDATKLP